MYSRAHVKEITKKEEMSTFYGEKMYSKQGSEDSYSSDASINSGLKKTIKEFNNKQTFND